MTPPKYLGVTFGAVCDEHSPTLLRLDALRHTKIILSQYARDLATSARSQGATWSEIGNALGITRQAAFARYSKSFSDLLLVPGHRADRGTGVAQPTKRDEA